MGFNGKIHYFTQKANDKKSQRKSLSYTKEKRNEKEIKEEILIYHDLHVFIQWSIMQIWGILQIPHAFLFRIKMTRCHLRY